MTYSSYCIHDCGIGKRKAKELLQGCDSIGDAAIDMQEFVCTQCEDCPLKED